MLGSEIQKKNLDITMKFAVVFAAVLAVAVAAPVEEKDAHIVQYQNDNQGIDGYNFQWVLLFEGSVFLEQWTHQRNCSL